MPVSPTFLLQEKQRLRFFWILRGGSMHSSFVLTFVGLVVATGGAATAGEHSGAAIAAAAATTAAGALGAADADADETTFAAATSAGAREAE